MAEISIRFISTGTRSYTVGNDVVGGVMKMEAIGSGGAGGTAAVNGGGGGKGGAYARRNAQPVSAGQSLTFTVPALTATTAGSVATIVSNSTTLLSARGGAVGGNGSVTAGGAGATAQIGTFVGDVEFTGGNGTNGNLTAGGTGGGGAGNLSNTTGQGPNTQFGVSSGSGGASAAAGSAFGGAGGGATTLAARGAGAQGIVVLTYSTGTGTTNNNAMFSRLATLFRVTNNSITNTSIFNRVVTIRRVFSNVVLFVSNETKQVQLPRISTASPTAQRTAKDVMLRKVAAVAHMSFVRKAITLGAKMATTINQSFFARAVTIRRTFSAVARPVGKLFLFLEARLIPREGGGGTVTNVFRNLFLFDD